MSNIIKQTAEPNLLSTTASAERRKPPPSNLTLGGLLRGLRKRWLLAAFLSLTLAGLATVTAWYGLPAPPHEASAIVHVSSVNEGVLNASASPTSVFTIYQQGQKALITSRLVINAALHQPKVNELSLIREQSDPIAWLQREMKVDFKSGPEYMRVFLRGNQPEEMRLLIAAVTEAYLQEAVNRERTRQLTHLEQLREIQNKYEESLGRKRKSVREMSVAVGTGDPQAAAIKQRYAFEALGQVERERSQVKSDLRKVQLELAAQEAREKNPSGASVSEVLIEKEIRQDTVLRDLIAKQSALEQMLAPMERRAVRGKNEPSLKPLYREVADLQAAAEARRKELRPLITEQLREQGVRERKLALVQANEREKFLKELDKQLGAEADGLRKQATSLNVGQLDIEHLKQEVAQTEKFADLVAARAESVKIETQAPARISLVEEAYVTQEDPTKFRLKGTAGVGIATFLLVLGIIGWREFRLRRVESSRELPDQLGIPLMGTVPALPGKRSLTSASDAAYRRWQGTLTECVDGARARLMHATGVNGVRLVMVTSAVPREGKTSLASHLAASLARAGQRTLLVDGDLRLPSLGRLFSLASQLGLAEVLRGEATAADAARGTTVEGLWVMPAGRPDLRAVQALSQPVLPALLQRLREEYDYVVVDSAPVLPVVDSLLLGQHVDAVVVSMLSGVSQLPLVQAAQQRLAELNIRVLGAVLNGADLQSMYGPWYDRGYEKIYQASANPSEPAPAQDREPPRGVSDGVA